MFPSIRKGYGNGEKLSHVAECYPNRSAVASRELEQPVRFPLAPDERRLLFHFPSVTAKFGLCVAPEGPDEGAYNKSRI